MAPMAVKLQWMRPPKMWHAGRSHADCRRARLRARKPAQWNDDQRIESQILRARLQMRGLLLRGEFRSGERLREIPLAVRLKCRGRRSAGPRPLEQEGLLTARPTGGFVAAEFSVQDIDDGIEIRGMLEGTAARLAAERLERLEHLAETR